jgi:hypothetical protein
MLPATCERELLLPPAAAAWSLNPPVRDTIVMQMRHFGEAFWYDLKIFYVDNSQILKKSPYFFPDMTLNYLAIAFRYFP